MYTNKYLGTENHETNPHYCDALDELYFDNADQDVLVFKNNKSTKLPEPINVENSQDFQPFLTDDCQTMYFTSNREEKLAIYKSERLGELDWSEPKLFISNSVGVAEFSMRADGKAVAFAQLSEIENGYTLDIYYSEKINARASNA